MVPISVEEVREQPLLRKVTQFPSLNAPQLVITIIDAGSANPTNAFTMTVKADGVNDLKTKPGTSGFNI